MNRERWAFLLLATSVLGYVVARAALVPWVHDECASLFWFVERGEFMPFSAHWDANNHILSSAIGTMGYRLMGLSLLGSRLGGVFAFVVFAWASYRIGSSVKGGMVRWCLWAALLLCPFMLEFFSLFRGYGLEIAFWLLAIDGLVRFAEGLRTRHLIQALIALLLANAAVLALVPLWAMIVVVLGLSLVWKWRTTSAVERFASIGTWLLLGLAPALFGLRVAFELRAQGLLYHGSTEGFMAVTAMPLLGYVFGTEHPVLPVATGALLIVLATIIVIRDRSWRSPGFVVAALFWGDVVLRIGMALVLDVNYPKDRAALHLLPLAILLLAFAADRLASRHPALRYVSLLLLALPLRALVTANVDHTSIWPEQSVPSRFIQRLAETQRGMNRPLVVGAYHQLELCLPFDARLISADIGVMDPSGFPNGSHDARIVDDRFLAQALPGYHDVENSPTNKLHLLLRDVPVPWERMGEQAFEQHNARAEFIEVWRSDTLANSEMLIEVDAILASDTSYLDLALVVSAKDGTGNDLLYNAIPLALIRPRWNGEPLHTAVRVPPVPGAIDRVVYIWNVRRSAVHFTEGRVAISVLDQSDPHQP